MVELGPIPIRYVWCFFVVWCSITHFSYLFCHHFRRIWIQYRNFPQSNRINKKRWNIPRIPGSKTRYDMQWIERFHFILKLIYMTIIIGIVQWARRRGTHFVVCYYSSPFFVLILVFVVVAQMQKKKNTSTPILYTMNKNIDHLKGIWIFFCWCVRRASRSDFELTILAFHHDVLLNLSKTFSFCGNLFNIVGI